VRTRFVYGARPQVPEYMERAGRRYRFVTDALGSVRKVVDTTSGEVVQEREYDPYGRVLSDSRPGFQPFGFAGGMTDRETGLVRFGARDYDPETGRWTSKDPAGFSGGDTNLYGYVLTDPVNLIDPEGLWSMPSATDMAQGTVGFFDEASFGFSREVRQVIGNDGNVDYCSTAYKVGGYGGMFYPLAGGGKTAVNGARTLAARGLPGSVVKRAKKVGCTVAAVCAFLGGSDGKAGMFEIPPKEGPKGGGQTVIRDLRNRRLDDDP
jgi:RHS repeat-associated protein